jgi:hypothetical protein
MLHLYIRADRSEYSLALREKTAAHTLRQYHLEKLLDSTALVKISERFHKYLQSQFGTFQIESGRLFRYQRDEQFFKGTIDYLLQVETGERVLILDVLMPFEEFKKRQKKKMEELMAYFRTAEIALQTQQPLDAGFQFLLHFPLEGKILGVER